MTCGKGRRERARSCVSPTDVVVIRGVPRRAGRGKEACPGEGVEGKDCRAGSCNGGRRRRWSGWGAWSSCSSSCLGGVRQRTRVCEGDRGECFASPTDTEECGTSSCPVRKMAGDGSMAALMVGGWRDNNWLDEVTVLHSDGRSCPAPALPIGLADHITVYTGAGKVLTCGGRSGEDTTLCWWLELASANSSSLAWSRAPGMGAGRSYGDAVQSEGRVWMTGGWNGKERLRSSEVLGREGGWREGAAVTAKRYQHCGVTLR